MKRFLVILALIATTLFTTVSCSKPKFSFDLTVTGYVIDQVKTGINADFNVKVSNVTKAYLMADNVVLRALGDEGTSGIGAWLEDFARKEVMKRMGVENAVEWEFSINGIVKEELTGISAEVHKTWSSKDKK